jgi:putative phosphoribosyl transferase
MKAQSGTLHAQARANADEGTPGFSAMALRVPAGEVTLVGDLEVPGSAAGFVIFAHGSGSSRFSPRNHFVARTLRDAGIGTFLFDLLTPEEMEGSRTGELGSDIELLATRLVKVTKWLAEYPATSRLPFGYFGTNTGAAAALRAAACLPAQISVIVSRGGRPDLATDSLERVRAATLLIVGALDHAVLRRNQRAFAKLACAKDFVVIPHATHFFKEPGALEDVAKYSVKFYRATWSPSAVQTLPAAS